ncbi:MAG: AAA family ATPase [Candidatus Paceibacterota bacterium]|jgi:chromosome segregation protein
MLLKSLEISGFKSFAKKTTLEFSSSISAIVGPNGSGKSNVAEAFRFVLGEQSIKSLRGKRGEDLIFNGGKTLARQNRASVKLTFDNRSRVFPIDFDEIVIERVVHRDSVNEYLLNGTSVRLKDITELLFSANIGSSGYHIISQGEADRMLSASIKERRAMLEEALGLKMYQVKKEESERKLVKTAENIASVESLRREIAPHIRFLKKQVEKYEKAIALREELTSLYLVYLHIEDNYLTKEKLRIAELQVVPEENKKNIASEIASIKEVLNKKDEHKKEGDEIISLQSKTSDVRFRKESLMRDAGKIEAEISYINRSIREEELKMNESELKTIPLSEVGQLKKDIDAYVEESESVTDISILRSLIQKIKQACASFVETRASSSVESENKKALLMKEREDKTKEKGEIERSISVLSEEEQTLRAEEIRIKSEMDKQKDDTFEAEKKMLELMSKEQECESELHSLRLEEEKVNMLHDEFKKDLYEAGMLLGSDILKYKEATMSDIVDVTLTVISSEDRSAQIERRRNIERNKIRLEETGGGNGADVMKEFEEVTTRDQFLEKELIDLHQSSESLQTLITDLETKIDTEFKEGVEKINKEFNNFFTLMFGGGHATLALVKEEKRKVIDEEEGLEETEEKEEVETKEGIEIDVGLPHKKTKGLVMLSGGERALTSIALLFAISQVNPPPFVILDETDAALDEANSKKYGDMIVRLSAHSGLILITHNRETMSRAGVIYGVTMGSEGFSKLLSIQFDEAVAVAK